MKLVLGRDRLSRSTATRSALWLVLGISLVNIACGEDTQDEEATRTQLLEHLWPDGALPDAMPDLVVLDTQDLPRSDIDREFIERVDKLVFNLDFEMSSTVWIYHPKVRNSRVVVYHGGHADIGYDHVVVSNLLPLGFTVATVQMLGVGSNSGHGPSEHSELIELEADHPNIIRLFVEPVHRIVSYLATSQAPEEFIMLGLSGGGWTTVLAQALDLRIRRGYSVAGALPFDLRLESDRGDFEQFVERPIYAIADYRTLFAQGTSQGRLQVHVFNEDDPCCFSWAGREASFKAWEAETQRRLPEVEGGDFQVLLVPNDEHNISAMTFEFLRDELTSSGSGQ